MCMTEFMNSIAAGLVGLVAVLHVYFMVLEMLLWTKPYGRRVFGLSAEKAEVTKTLAMNQGLYNGFLAAGLGWGLTGGLLAVKIFFLACVVVAGVFGAMTVSRKILWVQAGPAAIALVLLCVAD